MKLILRFGLMLLCCLPLVSRADLLTQTLSGKGGEAAIFSIAGHWVDEKNNLDLQLFETTQSDEFKFVYTENNNIWKGLLETSYYDTRVVLQVDLTKLTLNDKAVIQLTQPVYLMFGGFKIKKDEFKIAYLDQSSFRKLLGKHFYASELKGKCTDATSICKEEFNKHYMLSPKNTADMNKEFANRFGKVFPKKAAKLFTLKDE